MSKCILAVTVNPAVDVTVTAPPVGQLRMRSDVPPKAEVGVSRRLESFLGRDADLLEAEASAPTPDILGQGVGTAHLRMRCSTNCVLSAGGKGVNVARALRTLGVRALAAGFAGGGTGDLLQKLLREEKIPAAFVSTGEPTRLNVTVPEPRTGRCTRVVQEGPRLTPREIRRFENQYRRWLRHSRWVVLSGRNAVGAPADWYARLVRLAQREGVPVAVDTSGAALCAALKARPFLVKPNREEAEALVRYRFDSPAKIKKVLRHFHDRGVRVVLLSLGVRGAVVSDGQNIWYARPPRVRAANEVGCGDALLAGFLAAFEKKSLAEALRQGVACGTANVLGPTPGSIRPGDVSRLVKKVTVKNWGTLRR